MQQVNSPALKLLSCVSNTAWPHAKVAVSRTTRSYVVLLGSIIESFGGDAVQSPPGFLVVVVMVKVVVVEMLARPPPLTSTTTDSTFAEAAARAWLGSRQRRTCLGGKRSEFILLRSGRSRPVYFSCSTA